MLEIRLVYDLVALHIELIGVFVERGWFVQYGDTLKVVCGQIGIHGYDFQNWEFLGGLVDGSLENDNVFATRGPFEGGWLEPANGFLANRSGYLIINVDTALNGLNEKIYFE